MDPGVTRLVGLDLSLTSTGVARLTLDTLTGEVAGTSTDAVGWSLDSDATVEQRARRIRDLAGDITRSVAGVLAHVDLVVVEGPSFGSNRPGASELHGLRWAVLARLAAHEVPIVVVAPKTLKLYGAGDGNAPKTTVVQAVRRHYGDRFDIPLRKADGREDIADAIVLVAMAARSIGHPIDLDHPTRLRAMAAPRWVNREDNA